MSDGALHVGQTLMVGLGGPVLGTSERERLLRLRPAGVILFARNLQSPEKLEKLMLDLASCLPRHPLVALDQEGGIVSRLRPWIGETPTASRLAELGSRSTERFARLTGEALRSLGFNLDFAPVVDLCGPSVPNGIGVRSFGTDPERAGTLAEAFLNGLGQAGVAGCLKHFPGLGDTAVDSHETLPTCRRPLDELEAADLVPYRRLSTRSPMVMIGHAHYTAWHPELVVPATASGTIITELLKGSLGFRGTVVSDDLEMGAVIDLDVNGAFAIRAMTAGCDLLLYCRDLERAERALEAMDAASRADAAFRDRIRSAADATTALARRFPRPTPDLSAWGEARDQLSNFER